ncbi:hypothetical protein F4813DRAFT_364648 [Daldinia decipiens]|uniref:uncharacterized protein n=1 Tax=Daldinia decipiens TaxID=326647 RepID=UPI0020C1EF6D|nr:uncharacterized protein F4813DRAFT_364648 [Daldinia decipiens]KAI1656207.1 hypothetical protein F4813DRAFT_364648 [Daldinia decipiens]
MGSLDTVIPRVRSELCEDPFPARVPAWGPGQKNDGVGFIHSWTDTICKDIGTARHFINCCGSFNGQQCLGRWSRRTRERLEPGLYCVFGSHVMFDGFRISGIPSAGDRNLKRLRNLWAEHVLKLSNNTSAHDQTAEQAGGGPLVKQAELDTMLSFLQKAIAKSASKDDAKSDEQRKVLGNGAGGRAGVTETGVVMKRDSGDEILGNGQDRCDQEPGGYFEIGDLEIWVTWHGWSSLGTRDGRWRPGFHFEILLGLFTTIIDYGTNRKLWRAREKPWVTAAEWIWLDTPNDVHSLFTEGVIKDMREIFRREVQRVQNLVAGDYKADNFADRKTQYPLFLDRGGEYISRHLVGQPLTSDRGYILAWVLCVPNDLQDYERDVLGGETNNLIRGLTSAQQVVDASYLLLRIVEAAYAHEDFDMVTAVLGVCAYFTMTWRYNTSKQFKLYEAISVRGREFSSPVEVAELVALVEEHYPMANRSDDTYGELFDRVASIIKPSYWGCTCDSKPRGHDTWSMLRQALDEGDNDALEEQMHVEFSYLSIGASNGDIRCECGLDLLSYEGFLKFFDPDTGLISRLHYKTSTSDGNLLAE